MQNKTSLWFLTDRAVVAFSAASKCPNYLVLVILDTSTSQNLQMTGFGFFFFKEANNMQPWETEDCDPHVKIVHLLIFKCSFINI